MHDAERVGSHESARHLGNDGVGLVRAQFSRTIERGAEILAFEKFHHDEGHAIPDPVLEHLDHVRAADLSRRPGFAREAREDLGVSPVLSGSRSLSAQRRSSDLSCASHTLPIPPEPIFRIRSVALRYQ